MPERWTVEESTDRPADYPGTKIIVFNEARMQVAELYHGATGELAAPAVRALTK
ncbi:hypothetical protein PJ267_06340 [Arthrobacter sp. OVS8]|nr:hypothetical protein PJ267_06340 [Arthrobacter sp. OVS8]